MGRASKSSPEATKVFVIAKLEHGNRQQKLNALYMAGALESEDRYEPGKEHPLLKHLFLATSDSDTEVRRIAARTMYRFASDANHPEGRKALRRFVEMFADPEPRVRAEAASQASLYPCPEVLELLIKLLEAEEDRWARDSITRSIKSLEERLRTLAGSGRKPVLLHDRGG